MWWRSPPAQAAWWWQMRWVCLGGCFQAGCCRRCSPESWESDLSGYLHLTLPGAGCWVQAEVSDSWSEVGAAVGRVVPAADSLEVPVVAGTVECWQQEG